MTEDSRPLHHAKALTAALGILFGLVFAIPAEATPLYTVRAGRTCDNCHSLPNTWYDPPEVMRRKCTLSCASCHVDPNGGGLRNTSGRYYGMSTLPMFFATGRPFNDRNADELGEMAGPDGEPTTQPTTGPTSGPSQPADSQRDPRPEGSPEPNDGPNIGRPFGHGTSEMAWLDGRYGDLNADPLVQAGADARLGFWDQGSLVFPMQADFHLAVHPVEHLTFFGTAGARGRTAGFDKTRDERTPFELRDVWVMTHEWPALAYARAGRFLPAFGWRIEDHTAFTRRPFGLSQENPGSRVLGTEVGFTGNYPYANISAFVPVRAESGGNPAATDDGWGSTVNAGYRHMGWSLGASAMVRRRPLDIGGDTVEGSLQWAFNPWYYAEGLPISYLGEVVFGSLQRPFSGNKTTQMATTQIVSWTVVRGFSLQARHDFWEPDHEVIDDAFHRPGVGAEWVVMPGLTLRGDLRVGIPEGAELEEPVDFFLQVHGWF